MRYKKNIIIGVMCIAVLIMGLGYALLSTQIDILGSTSVTSTWKIEFSNIRTKELYGGATNVISPIAQGTNASFEVDLVLPGDYVLYEIDITNYGDIDAEVKGATYNVSGTDSIFVYVDGIKKGTKLPSCEGLDTCPTITLTLKVGFDGEKTTLPEDKRKDIEFTIEVGQCIENNSIPESDLIPELVEPLYLSSSILRDNIAQADTNIDFSKGSDNCVDWSQCEVGSNGLGLYYTNKNTENNGITYYFRGNVSNNYVQFGKDAQGKDIMWKIVRINEDGSIRLIYWKWLASLQSNDGVWFDFNITFNDNAYVGYMYGDTNATGINAYKLTHTNTHDSEAKIKLENWYATNLLSYSEYIADAGFCNDRSIASTSNTWASDDTALGYGANITYYGAYNRIVNEKQPQFACPNPTNDLFTTTTSNKGNKATTYPIGLLTIDEIIYAGFAAGSSSTSDRTYLPSAGGGPTFTFTPSMFDSTYGTSWFMFTDSNGAYWDTGGAFHNGVSDASWPVINLKSTVELSTELPSGCTKLDGTEACPYIIKTN